jgi:hypothetical protein
MSSAKKQVREAFRRAVFERARYRCQGPGCKVAATPANADALLDAHHITDRHEMPNGGYVAENGISLCKAEGGCHEKAEAMLQGHGSFPGFEPERLYVIVGSSREKAERASRRLGEG